MGKSSMLNLSLSIYELWLRGAKSIFYNFLFKFKIFVFYRFNILICKINKKWIKIKWIVNFHSFSSVFLLEKEFILYWYFFQVSILFFFINGWITKTMYRRKKYFKERRKYFYFLYSFIQFEYILRKLYCYKKIFENSNGKPSKNIDSFDYWNAFKQIPDGDNNL